MKKVLLFILFLNFVFAKEVLLLHSYHKGYKWSDDISKAIEKKFATQKNIELTTLYMNTKMVVGSSYFNKLANLYKQQLVKKILT